MVFELAALAPGESRLFSCDDKAKVPIGILATSVKVKRIAYEMWNPVQKMVLLKSSSISTNNRLNVNN